LIYYLIDSLKEQIADPAKSGVICETWVLLVTVIPAKAGIHSANFRKGPVDRLDSRFCGNDCDFEHPCLAKYTPATQPMMRPFTLIRRLKWINESIPQ
jgi:hypothetical protein